MKVVEVVRLKKKDSEGLKSFIVLKYGYYKDKKTGVVYVGGLRTAQQVKAKSETELVAKMQLQHDVRLIVGEVNFLPDDHGMRQLGGCVVVTEDLNPLLLEVED